LTWYGFLFTVTAASWPGWLTVHGWLLETSAPQRTSGYCGSEAKRYH
jgi:hypothetical protein